MILGSNLSTSGVAGKSSNMCGLSVLVTARGSDTDSVPPNGVPWAWLTTPHCLGLWGPLGGLCPCSLPGLQHLLPRDQLVSSGGISYMWERRKITKDGQGEEARAVFSPGFPG